MKRFFIVGLGMMGSSYAKKLSSLGYQVFGYDQDELTVNKALALNIIKSASLNELSKVDMVILTLYPKDNVLFLKENLDRFNEKQIITDIAGVKLPMLSEIESFLPKSFSYLSHHPMAGSEKSGIDGLNETIFKGANFLIISNKHANQVAEEALRNLAKDLEFGAIKVIDAETHDKMIGLTSQLPHMLAVSLVNSDSHEDTRLFSGDSYRDLTRIASINDVLWIELFNENKEFLLNDMERFQSSFNELYEALKNNDIETLKTKLVNARKKRDLY
ncbi:MAG: prephenate dehydrogenase [Acholeplasmataceae bacterium]|nr:prephenate dehydrogenase [Acholeplasmataceae bacterium]